MTLRKKIISALALTAGLASCSIASAQNDDALLNKMRAIFSGTPITSVQKVDHIPGLVELVVGKNKIIYASEDGKRVVIGHIYDPKTNIDVTQTRINNLTKIDFSNLPFKDSFTIKKGDGSREVAIFTDPDCPYCKKLGQGMAKMDNYTAHIFLFPLNIHPKARERSRNILCSSDPAKAYEDYIVKGIEPPKAGPKCDSSAISRNVKFGAKNGISGTPFLIGKDGTNVPGFMEPKRLARWLNTVNKEKNRVVSK